MTRVIGSEDDGYPVATTRKKGTRKARAVSPGELLTNEQQYFQDVHQVPIWTTQEEAALVARARQGDSQAREAVILSCLRYIKKVAWKYTMLSRAESTRIEYLDVVGVGNLTVVEWLDKALAHPNPLGYLRRAICGAIIDYCLTHRGLIRPFKVTAKQRSQSGTGGYQPDYDVTSLSAPLSAPREDGEAHTLADVLVDAGPAPRSQRDYTSLYRAIEHLPPSEREVITRSYGIDCAPQTLNALGLERRTNKGLSLYKEDSASKRTDTVIYKRHARGLAHLQQQLAGVDVQVASTSVCYRSEEEVA